MKKFFSLILTSALIFVFCGCGKELISTASAEQSPPEQERITVNVADLAGAYTISKLLIDGSDETNNIESLEAAGLYCKLTVNEDGSGVLYVFDTETNVVFDGERMLMFTTSSSNGTSFTYASNSLSLVYNEYELTFTK